MTEQFPRLFQVRSYYYYNDAIGSARATVTAEVRLIVSRLERKKRYL